MERLEDVACPVQQIVAYRNKNVRMTGPILQLQHFAEYIANPIYCGTFLERGPSSNRSQSPPRNLRNTVGIQSSSIMA
jgi:hypothetical protein